MGQKKTSVPWGRRTQCLRGTTRNSPDSALETVNGVIRRALLWFRRQLTGESPDASRWMVLSTPSSLKAGDPHWTARSQLFSKIPLTLTQDFRFDKCFSFVYNEKKSA